MTTHRRTALATTLGALVAPWSVLAQTAVAAPRIGWVSVADAGTRLEDLRFGLRESGYVGTRELRIDVRVAQRDAQSVQAAVNALLSAPVALIVAHANAGLARASQIADFAHRERLLCLSGWAEFAQAGCVASYGPSLRDGYRRLAHYVDRILKGAHPSSLPVELPTRFELVVNLKTAKAIGLTVAPSVLLRADEVIQ